MWCNLHLRYERIGGEDVGRVGGHVCQVTRRHVVHPREDVVSGVELHVTLVSVEEVDVAAVAPNVLGVLQLRPVVLPPGQTVELFERVVGEEPELKRIISNFSCCLTILSRRIRKI